MKKLISCVLLGAAMLVPSGMDAATVRLRSRTLSYSEDTPYGKIDIMFSKCMANQLYTFLSVSVDGTILNQTSSDNIGPFLAGGEWMGGNHTLSSGAKSARTVSYSVALDGEELTGTVSKEEKYSQSRSRMRLSIPTDRNSATRQYTIQSPGTL